MRKLGSKSSVPVTLAELVAKLPASQVVKVSVGWLKAVQEAHSVTINSVEGGESAGASDAAGAAPAGPKFEVD